MWKLDTLLMGAAALLLLVVNWLAFHDYLEPHTVRDWLTLLASVLVWIQFARMLWLQNDRRHAADLA
jgi:hypothetical protein